MQALNRRTPASTGSARLAAAVVQHSLSVPSACRSSLASAATCPAETMLAKLNAEALQTQLAMVAARLRGGPGLVLPACEVWQDVYDAGQLCVSGH